MKLVELHTKLCLCCNKNYQQNFNKKLKERFFLIHTNFLTMIIIFLMILIIFSLRKGVYRYEYMDNWEKFNETSQPGEEHFYSDLHMEDIADADYPHTKRVVKILKS